MVRQVLAENSTATGIFTARDFALDTHKNSFQEMATPPNNDMFNIANWHMRSLDPLGPSGDVGSTIAGPSHLGHHSLFINPASMIYQSVKSPNERKPGMFMSTYTGEKRRKNLDRYSENFTLGQNSIDSSLATNEMNNHFLEKRDSVAIVNKFSRFDKATIAR